MDLNYKLQVMVDRGDPQDPNTLTGTNVVRVRWYLKKSGVIEDITSRSANADAITDTFKGVLEDLPGVDEAYFTRYTAHLHLAEHITTPSKFMGMLKTFVENDLVAILGGRTQIDLSTEVTIL